MSAYYDFRSFHAACPGERQLTTHGGRTFVVCPHCQVAGELEAVSAKVDCASAFLTRDLGGKHPVRTITGQLSIGHPDKMSAEKEGKL